MKTALVCLCLIARVAVAEPNFVCTPESFRDQAVKEGSHYMNWESFFLFTTSVEDSVKPSSSLVAVCVDRVNTFDWAALPVLATTVVFKDNENDGVYDSIELTRHFCGRETKGQPSQAIVVTYHRTDNGKGWIVGGNLEVLPEPPGDVLIADMEKMFNNQEADVAQTPR